MLRKIVVFFVCFCFVFEQAGFAQVAPQPGVPVYLQDLAPAADKFRPIHLRAVLLDPVTDNIDLILDKGDTISPQKPLLEKTTQKLLEYFKVGLTLPNSMFWVNLRPDSPGDIIDPNVEQTDLGKVLLAADLQLKQDTARFTSPNTPEGKAYWDKLYQKAESLYGGQDVEIPTLTRPWIVPGEIMIGESQGGAYVYKATLKVMLEQDYLKDAAFYNFDDERARQLNDYSSQILRELIIPKLTREVNASKSYAPLRQVYYSLILAQWFKQKFRGSGSAYAGRIDTKDLTGLSSTEKWSKDKYYRAYKKSFSQGEYNLRESAYGAHGQTIRSYFSGGLALIAPKQTVSRILGNNINPALPGLASVSVSPSGDLRVNSPDIIEADGGEAPVRPLDGVMPAASPDEAQAVNRVLASNNYSKFIFAVMTIGFGALAVNLWLDNQLNLEFAGAAAVAANLMITGAVLGFGLIHLAVSSATDRVAVRLSGGNPFQTYFWPAMILSNALDGVLDMAEVLRNFYSFPKNAVRFIMMPAGLMTTAGMFLADAGIDFMTGSKRVEADKIALGAAWKYSSGTHFFKQLNAVFHRYVYVESLPDGEMKNKLRKIIKLEALRYHLDLEKNGLLEDTFDSNPYLDPVSFYSLLRSEDVLKELVSRNELNALLNDVLLDKADAAASRPVIKSTPLLKEVVNGNGMIEEYLKCMRDIYVYIKKYPGQKYEDKIRHFVPAHEMPLYELVYEKYKADRYVTFELLWLIDNLGIDGQKNFTFESSSLGRAAIDAMVKARIVEPVDEDSYQLTREFRGDLSILLERNYDGAASRVNGLPDEKGILVIGGAQYRFKNSSAQDGGDGRETRELIPNEEVAIEYQSPVSIKLAPRGVEVALKVGRYGDIPDNYPGKDGLLAREGLFIIQEGLIPRPGSVPGYRVLAAGETFEIGRAGNRIDPRFNLNAFVSPRHVSVRWEGNRIMISDLGSSNGTRVEYAQPQENELPGSDHNKQKAFERIEGVVDALKAGKYQSGTPVVDLRGVPPGAEIILVGDLHARKTNLEKILSDSENLEKIKNGKAVLIILGDAVHDEDDLREMGPSVEIMQRIMDLKIANPDNVYYVVGNHDYLSERMFKGGVPQGLLYAEKLRELFGDEYVAKYNAFLKASPLVVIGNGFAATHAGPILENKIPGEIKKIDVLNEDDPVVHQAVWGRYKHPKYYYDLDDVKNFLSRMGLKDDAVLIVGHSPARDGNWHWKIAANHHIIFAAESRVGYARVTDGKADFIEVNDGGQGLFIPLPGGDFMRVNLDEVKADEESPGIRAAFERRLDAILRDLAFPPAMAVDIKRNTRIVSKSRLIDKAEDVFTKDWLIRLPAVSVLFGARINGAGEDISVVIVDAIEPGSFSSDVRMAAEIGHIVLHQFHPEKGLDQAVGETYDLLCKCLTHLNHGNIDIERILAANGAQVVEQIADSGIDVDRLAPESSFIKSVTIPITEAWEILGIDKRLAPTPGLVLAEIQNEHSYPHFSAAYIMRYLYRYHQRDFAVVARVLADAMQDDAIDFSDRNKFLASLIAGGRNKRDGGKNSEMLKEDLEKAPAIAGPTKTSVISDLYRKASQRNPYTIYPVSLGAYTAYIFGDHGMALAAWELERLRGNVQHGSVLVHVDAHPDDAKGAMTYDAPRTPEDVRKLYYNVNQFIAPAACSGLVKEIYWVKPDYIFAQGDYEYWAAAVIMEDGTEKAFFDMHAPIPGEPLGSGKIQTIKERARSVMVHEIRYPGYPDYPAADILPDLTGGAPVILDIDLDFFANKRAERKGPGDAASAVENVIGSIMKKIDPGVVTIALSDGYTSEQHMQAVASECLENLPGSDPIAGEPVVLDHPFKRRADQDGGAGGFQATMADFDIGISEARFAGGKLVLWANDGAPLAQVALEKISGKKMLLISGIPEVFSHRKQDLDAIVEERKEILEQIIKLGYFSELGIRPDKDKILNIKRDSLDIVNDAIVAMRVSEDTFYLYKADDNDVLTYDRVSINKFAGDIPRQLFKQAQIIRKADADKETRAKENDLKATISDAKGKFGYFPAGQQRLDGGDGQAQDRGGIDLRSLPIVITAAGAAKVPGGQAAAAPADAAALKTLQDEWENIRQQMRTGPMPYARMKGYAASCKEKGASRQMDTMIACIACILRMEEDLAVATTPELKEILTTIG
ncbi:MAG: UPF0489 family protein [Candidatus Omnitrophota bacterium]